MNKKELKQAGKQVEKIAMMASKLLLRYQKKLSSLKIKDKKSNGIASEADFAAEKLIIKELKKKFPKIPFLAEEDAHGRKIKEYSAYKDLDYCWVIDPLDGTNNFCHGIDYYSVSIGLVKKGEPVVGVVARPSVGEIYSAVTGEGTWIIKGTKRTRIKKLERKTKIKDCILGTGFGTRKVFAKDEEKKLFLELLPEARAIRRMGSAALDLCYVGLGRFDAYWEVGLSPWDVAAGILIVSEAGGKMTELDGKRISVFSPSYLAARPGIHQKLTKTFLKVSK